MNVLCFCSFFPLTLTLRIQLSGFFAYPFRFLKVLSQLDQIIEEALYPNFGRINRTSFY